MSDNVVKFRRIEKQPEKPPQKKPGMPGWLPWAGLIVLALIVYFVQRSGALGG